LYIICSTRAPESVPPFDKLKQKTKTDERFRLYGLIFSILLRPGVEHSRHWSTGMFSFFVLSLSFSFCFNFFLFSAIFFFSSCFRLSHQKLMISFLPSSPGNVQTTVATFRILRTISSSQHNHSMIREEVDLINWIKEIRDKMYKNLVSTFLPSPPPVSTPTYVHQNRT
jgi:hypothetical protein